MGCFFLQIEGEGRREEGLQRRGAVPPRIIYNLGLGGPSDGAVTLTHFRQLSGLEAAIVLQPQATDLRPIRYGEQGKSRSMRKDGMCTVTN